MIYTVTIFSTLLIASNPLIFKKILIYALLLFPLFLLAFFRGNVGTDTQVYEAIFHEIQLNENNLAIKDLFFIFYAKILHLLKIDSFYTTRFITVIIYIQLILYLTKSTKRELLALICIIAPAFLIPFTMNIVRAGTAVMFFLLFTKAKNKKQKIAYFSLGLCSHTSVIICFISYILSTTNFQKTLTLKTFLYTSTIISVLCLAFFLKFDFILEKLDSYINYSSPSFFSGLSRVPLFLSMLFLSLFIKERLKFISLLVLFTMPCLYLIQYSYGFLRLLDLIIIGFLFGYVRLADECTNKINTKEHPTLLINGFVLAYFTLSNIYDPSSNFIPYHTLL